MTSQGRKIDPKTVDRYLRGLTDSLLFYEARRYNIKGKRLLASMSKYYVCDVALRSLLVRSQGQRHRPYPRERRVSGAEAPLPGGLCGPVWNRRRGGLRRHPGRRTVYYQVAQTTLDEQVLARELAPLRQIRDNYPKYLLTMDEAFGEMNYEGIQKRNVLKWMLE